MADHTQYSDEQLIEYVVGDSAVEMSQTIATAEAASPSLAAHIARIRCVVEGLRESIVEPPPVLVRRVAAEMSRRAASAAREPLTGRLLRFVAELIHDSGRQVALPGFRGSSRRIHLTYWSALGEIDLQIAEHRATTLIRGQISTAGPDDIDAIQEIRLLNKATDSPVGSCTPDDDGQFELSVLPGEYDLHAVFDTGLIIVPDLSIQ